MSLMDNGSNMFMPVAPAGYAGGSTMGWGDGSFWIIVLFLFALMGNGWNGGFGGGGGAVPYFMNSNNDVQRGFDQSAVMNGISGIQNSLASAEVARCNSQANILATLNANQNANTAAMNSLAMGLQNCCCENRQQIADVKYAIATDGAATRANTDAKVQNVMDKLCQMELDGIKQNYENRIANMQSQIDALQGLVNNANRDVALANEVDALYNRLNSCPVPTTPVYGRTPIFTCSNNENPACRCGGNTGFVA